MIWMWFLALAALLTLYCYRPAPMRSRLLLQGPQSAACKPIDPTGDSK